MSLQHPVYSTKKVLKLTARIKFHRFSLHSSRMLRVLCVCVWGHWDSRWSRNWPYVLVKSLWECFCLCPVVGLTHFSHKNSIIRCMLVWATKALYCLMREQAHYVIGYDPKQPRSLSRRLFESLWLGEGPRNTHLTGLSSQSVLYQ